MKTLDRIDRLERLESWLKSDEPLVLHDAARELGVSLRTVHRDLEVLRLRGIPVEADRGRGGGVRLPSSWGIGRVRLTRAETLDLLIGLAIGESAHATMQMGHADAIRRKLLASFSHADQRQIGALRRRIRVGPTASGAMVGTLGSTPQQVSDPLKEAFILGRVLTIRYKDGQAAMTSRQVEPHFLLHNPPIWYAVCWDHLRQQNRTFRCDRMQGATVTEQSFTPRPWSAFETDMVGNPTREI
ncbi:putative DNA-binding transcriptional regulator YafY [Rubricella aquisinus]|uniref:Putative DNA-binding transcriptional regulator YafY n=1 Tax=Rubricella aquisinus TaxID=2028108 RepID=A0A840WGF1_9RHOB|nr:WYL domain-containing protein [Rubricella aquisinus]MBB5514228.1 putative DNA-binding transcriptional regulator YafY [Rubricella aquisinus]